MAAALAGLRQKHGADRRRGHGQGTAAGAGCRDLTLTSVNPHSRT